MDRTLDVRTPESIALSYDLAGIGSRFLAVTIDLLVQIAVLFLIGYGFTLIGQHAPKAHTVPSRLVTNIAIGLVIGIIFMVFFGYFILFEGFWNGQTPGKKILGIRVVRDGGYPVDFSAALIRNLIRIGEWLLGGYAIAAVSALLSPENKRVGDFAAGTIVVRDARMESPETMLRQLAEEPVYAATTYLSGEERALIRRFLERRASLSEERRRSLAAQLAERVRPRLPADLQRLDDESLLERL